MATWADVRRIGRSLPGVSVGNEGFGLSVLRDGKHKGFACTDCHVVPTDFNVSSCVDCHTHNMAETDALHDGVDGYAFTSAACTMCHPKGSAGN